MKLALQCKEERELYKALTSSSNASRIAMYHGVAEAMVAGAIKKYLEVKEGKMINKPTMNLVLREIAAAINEEAILSLNDFNRIMSNVFRFKTAALTGEGVLQSPLTCMTYFEVLGLPTYFSMDDINAVNENMVDFKTALARSINVVDSILSRVEHKLHIKPVAAE